MKIHQHQGYKEFLITTSHLLELMIFFPGASGILALMEKFQTYFGLKLSVLVFDITEQFSVVEITAFCSCYHILTMHRSDESIRQIRLTNIAKEPKTSKKVNRWWRLAFHVLYELYRKEYFEVIDSFVEILKTGLNKIILL